MALHPTTTAAAAGSCRFNTLNTQLGAYSDFLSKKAL